jgi:predicted metal-dependent hydrolase
MHDDDRIRYRINQLTETGANISLALSEDIELEPVSRQQMILEAIDRAVTDKDVKQQIRPLLEAILKSEPQTLVKTYSQTVIQITMPKKRYEKIGSPRVGDKLLIDISRA